MATTPTFTEAEIKKLRDYMNFVNTHGEFTVKAPQMQDFIQLTSSVIHLMRKCESFIFEIKEHMPASNEEAGK